jgi:cytochrome c oxidase subunit III
MPPALNTETVLIHAPDEPFEPNTGGPQGPPESPPSDGHGGGGGDGRDDGDAGRKSSGMGLFGMRIALIPITVLFIATAFIFYARSRNGINWQSVPVPSLLWLSTALILISSWTLEHARSGLRADRYTIYIRWLLRTLYLGLGFLASQVLALQQLVTHGLFMRHNPHGSMFYIITASHGLHLFGGLIALAYLLLRAALHLDDSHHGRATTRRIYAVAALYWHFLAALWVCLFLLLLLWR